MPYRYLPFAINHIYHVFNRSIASQPMFIYKRDYERILEIVNYYRFKKPHLRFSHYNRLSKEQKEEYEKSFVTGKSPMVEILAYCIMPNYIHFLLRPKIEHAISDFMRNLQNSYSKYFNTKRNRVGSLFQSMFKAVRIETDEQLMHVSRYIHLNPVTSYLIEVEDLEHYRWSSYRDYILGEKSFVSTETIESHFKSVDQHKKFIFDQSEYQRELSKIKHLLFK